LNESFAKLIAWCGDNFFLLSVLEFGIGFLSALALSYLSLRIYAHFSPRGLGAMSCFHLALFFACAAWSIFTGLFSVKAEYSLQLLIPMAIGLGPISIFVGFPVLFIYAFRRPALNARAVYVVATAIIVTSYLCLAYLNEASRNS
jgi:hypothetical protein